MIQSDLQYYTICGIIFIITIIAGIISKFRSKNNLPPSPLALPIIGHLHLLTPIPHQAFHSLSNKYGPIMYLLLGSVPCVLASTAEIAKEFLKTHEISYADRPFSFAVDYLTYGSADFSFAPYGPYWKFMKKICMSELLGGRTLDQLLPVRREEIRRFLMLMLRKSDTGESINVGGELITMANSVISRMMMSKRCTDSEHEAEGVRKLVHEVAEITGKFNLSDYISFCKNLDLQGFKKKLKDIHVRFDAMAETILKEHEEARTNEESDRVKDLMDILLDVAEDDKAEMKLTRENIKAFILDIFAAGTDTSAITTEWALAELINHPDIFEKVREEIDSVIGNSRLVEESDIQNLPYLQAIVKETLRLHPTGPLIVRESTEDCTIAGPKEDESKHVVHISAGQQLDVVRWNVANQDEVACTSTTSNEVRIFDIGYVSSDPVEILQKKPTATVHGYKVPRGLSDIAFSPMDKSRLFASDMYGVINIWDRRTSNLPFVELTTNSRAPLNSIQLSTDNQIIYGAGKNGILYAWDLRGGRTSTSMAFQNYKDVSHPPLTTLKLAPLLQKIQSLSAQSEIVSREIFSIDLDPSAPYQLAFHLNNGWSGVINIKSSEVTHIHCPPPAWLSDRDTSINYTYTRKPAWLPTGSIYAVGSTCVDGIHLLDFYPSAISACHVDFNEEMETMPTEIVQNRFVQTSDDITVCCCHPLNGSIIAGTKQSSLLMISAKSVHRGSPDS